MPSQKIDHAGLRAERKKRWFGLAGVVIAIAILVISLSLHPNSHRAIGTSLSGIGDDGRRSR